MVTINLSYQGGLRCSATHAPSGNTLTTDAPVDNNGKGEAFSPSDLVATALGACMATVMGIVSRKENGSPSKACESRSANTCPTMLRDALPDWR